MIKRSLSLFIILILFLSSTACFNKKQDTNPNEDEEKTKLKVEVVDGTSKIPLEEVTVTINSSIGTTNSDGIVIFTSLERKQYDLFLAKNNYITRKIELELKNDENNVRILLSPEKVIQECRNDVDNVITNGVCSIVIPANTIGENYKITITEFEGDFELPSLVENLELLSNLYKIELDFIEYEPNIEINNMLPQNIFFDQGIFIERYLGDMYQTADKAFVMMVENAQNEIETFYGNIAGEVVLGTTYVNAIAMGPIPWIVCGVYNTDYILEEEIHTDLFPWYEGYWEYDFDFFWTEGEWKNSKLPLQDRIPIIFIHGIQFTNTTQIQDINSLSIFSNLANDIKNSEIAEYVQLYGFSYNTKKDSIDTIARKLNNEINRLNFSERDDIIIYAHSMGGLVSRAYIENYGGDNCVQQLITAGTPHLGVPPIVLHKYLPPCNGISNLYATEEFYETYPYYFWDKANNTFLTELNNNYTNISTNYNVVGGVKHDNFSRSVSWTGTYLNLLGIPNDGIVSEASARFGNRQVNNLGFFERDHIELVSSNETRELVLQQIKYAISPVALFSVTFPNSPNLLYEDITFDASESFSTSYIEEYHWDFGDGNSIIGDSYDAMQVKHSYQNEGIYTITLNIKAQNGKTDVFSKELSISNRDIEFASSVEDCIPGSGSGDNNTATLGPPDIDSNSTGYYNLGIYGSITLGYSNGFSNVPGDDIYVYELWTLETTEISISPDMEEWLYIGEIDGGFKGIDIGEAIQNSGRFSNESKFNYIKLTDVSGNSAWPAGADIDAVGVLIN